MDMMDELLFVLAGLRTGVMVDVVEMLAGLTATFRILKPKLKA